MRWQGCVESPAELSNIISPQQVAELDGIFYTCKSNRSIYVLKADSVAPPTTDVVVKVGNLYTSTPGRFIKINDIFLESVNGTPLLEEFSPDIGMAIVKSFGTGVFLKISDQMIQIGEWPVVI